MAGVILRVRRRLLARERVVRDRQNPMDFYTDDQLYSGRYNYKEVEAYGPSPLRRNAHAAVAIPNPNPNVIICKFV